MTHDEFTAYKQNEAKVARELAATLTPATAAKLLEDSRKERHSSLYARDVEDLRGVATLIEMGDTGNAFEIASQLDTAVRDVIPLAVWVYLGGDLVHG